MAACHTQLSLWQRDISLSRSLLRTGRVDYTVTGRARVGHGPGRGARARGRGASARGRVRRRPVSTNVLRTRQRTLNNARWLDACHSSEITLDLVVLIVIVMVALCAPWVVCVRRRQGAGSRRARCRCTGARRPPRSCSGGPARRGSSSSHSNSSSNNNNDQKRRTRPRRSRNGRKDFRARRAVKQF